MPMADIDFFRAEIFRRKQRADRVIDEYWQQKLRQTRTDYGDPSWQAMQAFADILGRGGKRIRPALAESSYRMFSGHDQQIIDGLSLVLEMVHAYLLIIDDISDRSDLRRGGPSAHRIMETWHRDNQFVGDRQHFGASVATLAAMAGMHQAMAELIKLPVSSNQLNQAVANLNQLLVATCHGQIHDFTNEAAQVSDEVQIERTLLWKTAYYSFVNPLQIGAILAGAAHAELELLKRYSLHAGRAFQLSDDLLCLFGTAANIGKNPMDDIREGKRTLLIIYALETAAPTDAAFLSAQLGNVALTSEAFERCKRIIQDCGARDHAQAELETSCHQAQTIIKELPDGNEQCFLLGLTDYLRTRKS